MTDETQGTAQVVERQLILGMAQVEPGPLGVWIYASFQRLPRGRCTQCGQRRVLFTVGLFGNHEISLSPGRCAVCSGIR